MNITRKQMIAFLVEHLNYDAVELRGIPLEDLKSGLNMEEVERFIE